MADIKIPFKYCKIDRAARLLNIEVDDIINLAANNYIELCLNLYCEPASLHTSSSSCNYKKIIEIEEVIDELQGLYFANDKAFTDLSAFVFSSSRKAKKSDLNIKTPVEIHAERFLDKQDTDLDDTYLKYFSMRHEIIPIFIARGTANGLWRISSHSFKDFEIGGNGGGFINDGDFYLAGDKRFNENYDFYISLDKYKDKNFQMGENNIWISRETVSLLINSNFDLDKLEENKKINIKKESSSNVKDESISQKSINTRTQFIKSLLYIHYGNDVAESPRRFMEGKDSVILDDFKNKGIIPPSGKAVQDWLKFTEIPFKSQE
ncbi:hypothetical protein [Providencia stuartii]|uniref:hypothetical protein n=1 Tax=Providencia stuartii TaxID=588 RepID=UPI003D7F88BF